VDGVLVTVGVCDKENAFRPGMIVVVETMDQAGTGRHFQ